MPEIQVRGDVAMNLVGLILIAALSGCIVAVSLRLRASGSAPMWLNGDRLHEEPSLSPKQSLRGRGAAWLQGPFDVKGGSGIKGESGLYRG